MADNDSAYSLSRDCVVQRIMFARCALFTVRETMMANPETDDRFTNAIWGIEESLERLEDMVMEHKAGAEQASE